MLTPFIDSLNSNLSPWNLYRRLYAEGRVSFFLDSVSYRPPDQRYSYIGISPFLEVVIKPRTVNPRMDVSVISDGKEKTYPASGLFRVLRDLLGRYRVKSGKDFFTGGAVGYWGYELCSLFDEIPLRKKEDSGLPVLYLGFYSETVTYDHAKGRYYLSVCRPADEKGAAEKAGVRFAQMREWFSAKKMIGPDEDDFRFLDFKPGQTREQFESSVRKAKEYIAAGDIYQANLSQRFTFTKEGSATHLYEKLRGINPSPFSSFLKFGDLEIISSSPERLVSLRGRDCETRPIAGTRPRRREGSTGKGLRRELLSSDKERAEHIMLVDLERNDLGRVCDWKSVKVDELMTIEEYSHVIHIVSKVTGRLAKNRDCLDLIRAMFPGGTITGCPKIRCMQVIDELEPVHRGLYTGSIGYLDFSGDLDLNIVIRTLVVNGDRGHLQVGAGIVHDSDPSREFEETLHKGEALVEALEKASRAELTAAR